MVKVVRSLAARPWSAPIGWLVGLVAACCASEAVAHLPDTSYARFSVSKDEFTAKLTYDVTSLIRLHPSLDANNDGRLTLGELDTAVPTIAALLKASIAFELNGQPAYMGQFQPVQWPAEAAESIPESEYHAATSLISFAFVKRLSVRPADFWVRFDFFQILGLRHTVLGAIEKEGDEQEVLFSAFEPDYFFETGFAASAPDHASASDSASASDNASEPGSASEPASTAGSSSANGSQAAAAAQPSGKSVKEERRGSRSLGSRLRQFFVFGVEHILIGYDHILFLLSLIIVSRFHELVKIVTSFTIAHSLTLALATLRWVDLPATLVETLIAATIVITAIENFWIEDTSRRWKVAFLFGLIHGFGFAGVLRDLDLPTQGFVRSLLAFNLGVEVGQLAIVALLAGPISLLRNHKRGKAIQRSLSAMIALCGLGWFLDRALGLGWMPF